MLNQHHGLRKIWNFVFHVYGKNSRVSDTRGEQNKQGDWQISAKIIKEESAINGEVDKISKVNKRGGWQKHRN